MKNIQYQKEFQSRETNAGDKIVDRQTTTDISLKFSTWVSKNIITSLDKTMSCPPSSDYLFLPDIVSDMSKNNCQQENINNYFPHFVWATKLKHSYKGVEIDGLLTLKNEPMQPVVWCVWGRRKSDILRLVDFLIDLLFFRLIYVFLLTLACYPRMTLWRLPPIVVDISLAPSRLIQRQ